MTRVVHTADVHLDPDHPERYEAFEAVLDRATDVSADLVTVGGDLFDAETAADALRPDLRETLSERPFDVIAIPGNHDAEAFRDDVFFGGDFRAATERPFETRTVGDLRLTLLPYVPAPDRDLLVALRQREPFDGTEALVLHCSLDAPFEDRETGEEADPRYFPVGAETLAGLGFDWYLAGHFHGPHRVPLPGGGTFVYPGSPASVTRAEHGRRQVAVCDTADGSLSLEPLETFHYDRLRVTVTPGEESEVIDRVETWCSARTERNAECTVGVTGHVAMDEAAFDAALADASGPIPVANDARSVRDLLTHGLYEAFEARLDELASGRDGGGPVGHDGEVERDGTGASRDGGEAGRDGGEAGRDDGETERNDAHEGLPAGVDPDAVRRRVLAALSELRAEGELS